MLPIRASALDGAVEGRRVVTTPPAHRVVLTREGPLLLEGPVEVVLDDGRTVRSDRPMVALCLCRRSHRYPFCDTSHRERVRRAPGAEQ